MKEISMKGVGKKCVGLMLPCQDAVYSFFFFFFFLRDFIFKKTLFENLFVCRASVRRLSRMWWSASGTSSKTSTWTRCWCSCGTTSWGRCWWSPCSSGYPPAACSAWWTAKYVPTTRNTCAGTTAMSSSTPTTTSRWSLASALGCPTALPSTTWRMCGTGRRGPRPGTPPTVTPRTPTTLPAHSRPPAPPSLCQPTQDPLHPHHFASPL